MLATSRKYDIVCLQLKNNYSQLENPLKKDLNKLLNDIKSILTSNNQIKQSIDDNLKQIFNLRVKALKWIFEEEGLDLEEIYEDIFNQIENLKTNSKFEILAENILFALRCNKRVIDSLVVSGDFSDENIAIQSPQLPLITYEQFITSIALAIPDDLTVQKIIDWTNSSLYIEFIAIAAATIADDDLKVSDKVINELAFIVADAAQNYFALATELGLLKSHHNKQTFVQNTYDKEIIKEQKILADLGLNDYFSNL